MRVACSEVTLTATIGFGLSEKQQQRDLFNRQAAKNAPEIAFFEDRLGLKIRGQGRKLGST